MPKYTFNQNPNPEAKIAFIIWNPFHYHVYKNIAKHLPNAEFVVCDTWYGTIEGRGREHIDLSVELLEKNKCFWRVFTDIFEFDAAQKFFQPYEIIVSVARWPPISVIALGQSDWTSKKKTVLISYGAGKDLYTFSPEVAHFDASLVDGPRTHRYHSLFTNSYAVGNPKFDDWFNNSFDKKEVDRLKPRLNSNKKTVLYLPTHSGLSSLYKFSDPICALSSEYNVLIKLHHHNPVTERKIVEKLEQNKRIFLFRETADILSLLFLADVVISDSSSAILEAILASKPLVILETMNDAQLLETHTKGEEFNQIWYSGGLTFPDSIEQQVKKMGDLCGVVTDKKGLRAAIEGAIRNHRLSSRRKRFLDKIFSYRDGTSGKRAAKVILDLLDKGQVDQPLLGMAARYYFKNLEKNYVLEHQKCGKEKAMLVHEVKQYRAIHHEKNLFKKTFLIIKNFF